MAKLSADQSAQASATQQAVRDALRGSARVTAAASDELLSLVADLSEEQVVERVGCAGRPLKRFAEQINASHPDASACLSDDVRSRIAGCLKSSIPDDSIVVKALVKPRLLRDAGRRDECRQDKKQPNGVSLKYVYVDGENCFYTKPETMGAYACGSKDREVPLEALRRQAELFERKGLKEIAAAVVKRIGRLEKDGQDTFNGFQRVKPEDAAIVMARFHGFRWDDHKGMIIIPFQYFEGDGFWQDEKSVAAENRDYESIDEMRRVEEVKRWIVFKEKKLSVMDTIGFQYEPRIYPLSHFRSIPEGAAEIVSLADAAMNGAPAFDYYWVVVPGISTSHPLLQRKSDGRWLVKNRSGDVESFGDAQSAAVALDEKLIKDKTIMPAVLGERDGKCYFLCWWA